MKLTLRSVAIALALAGRLGGGQPPESETVTLNLAGAELAKVLESFAIEYRLNIVAGSGVSGSVTLNLFEVPIEEALGAILAVNGYGFKKSGRFYLIDRTENLASVTDPEPLESEVVWLNYLRADEALRLIEPMKSERGVFGAGTPAETGIETGSSTGGNSSAGGEVLVLRDRRSVIDEVQRVLAKLDRRPRQVLVEATILEVRLDDETSLGVDFNTLAGVNFADLGAISGLDGIALAPANGAQIINGLGSIATNGFAGSGATDGLHIGFLADDVGLFVEALERATDATVLANPRVLAMDRQRAEIIIGAKLGFQTSTTTETATVQDVEFLDTGTQLRFRPFISADGYVRLEIHPENSTGVVDAATGLPSETTTEVTTNVLVKDGNTIAIGGLIGEQVENEIRQIPVLGDAPLIGWLFRRTVERVGRSEVIVLLTPHIVEDGEADTRGMEQADAMAKSRDLTFLRQLPISRTRLAAPLIEEAERRLSRGKPMDALRLAEEALSYMPSNVRASRLRVSALALLGLEDDEVRVLKELQGW